MARTHLPGLHIQQDGTVEVRGQKDLDRLLRSTAHDLSSEIIVLADPLWLQRSEGDRTSKAEFLNSAREQIIDAGRLPAPLVELPPVGTRAESVVTSRKPGPDSRYGMGTVTGHEWISLNGGWNIHVTFDEPAGTWCGMPIHGTCSGLELVHVIGGAGRAWSSMTPDEIDEFLEDCRPRRA
jgi:hypothetical protein